MDLNAHVVVMDAEDAGANGTTAYDVNELVCRVYDWQRDADSEPVLHLPPMASAAHRKVFYALAEKLGVRSSTVVLSGSEKRITLERPAGYVAKEWDSPFGPRSPQRKGNDKLPKGASQVLDFLWLGSGRDADDVDTLCTTGITHVLNVTAEWKESPELVLRRIEFRRIVIKDFVTETMSVHFATAFEFIDHVRALGHPARLLIHCVVGKSRSATVVLAYLMAREHLTLRQAFDHVWRVRENVRPNDSFVGDLLRMERELHGANSITLADLPAMKLPFSHPSHRPSTKGAKKDKRGKKDAKKSRGGGVPVDVAAWVHKHMGGEMAMLLKTSTSKREFLEACRVLAAKLGEKDPDVGKKRAMAEAQLIAARMYDADRSEAM